VKLIRLSTTVSLMRNGNALKWNYGELHNNHQDIVQS